MNLRNLFSVILSLTCLLAIAQVPSGLGIDIDWGPVHKIKAEQSIVDVDSGFVYALAINDGEGFQRKRWFFTKYNADDYSVAWQIETRPLEYKDGELSFLQVRIVDGEFYVFYSSFHKHEDEKVLLGQRISVEGVMGDLIPLGTIPTDDDRKGEFKLRWDQDEKSFLVINIPQFLAREDYRYELRIFDVDMNLKWEHKEEIRRNHDSYKVVDHLLGRDGKVYVLAYAQPDRKRGERDVRGKPNQYYALYRVTQEDNSIDELPLELDDYFVTSPWLYEDEYNMHIGGMYSVRDFDEADGFFFTTVDTENFKIGPRIDSPIPESITKRFARRGFLTDVFNEIGRPFKVVSKIRRGDGGAVMIQQVQYETVQYTPRVTVMGIPVSYNRIVTYHHEDYLIQSRDSTGTLEWTAHIPLRQAFTEDQTFLGALIMTNGEKIHLIFDDDKDNIEEWAYEKPRLDLFASNSLRRGNVVMVTLNTEGEVFYETMAPIRDPDEKLYFIPKACRQLGRNSNKAAIFSSQGRKVRVGTLTIGG